MKIRIHHFHSQGAAADQTALEQFQKQWATYQKLVDTDVLSHREVGAILHRALVAMPEPFAFLDIACGDAGQMPEALTGTKVRHYLGIDLAEPALELAAKTLAGVPFKVELDHRDFVTALTERPEPADAAWCGLSIHHLSAEGKLGLFKAIRGSIGSFLMIYEPALNDGETREAYLARFAQMNRPAWSFLTEEEWEVIDRHVCTCDFPETSANWIALGRDAGFAEAREVYCDPTGFYRAYRYDV
jgi:Methyltransferase domain